MAKRTNSDIKKHYT